MCSLALHRKLTLAVVLAMVLAVPAGTGAAAAFGQTDAQTSFDADGEQPTKEEVDAYGNDSEGGDDARQSQTLEFHEDDGGDEEGAEENSSQDGDSENYNENNVAVINLEDELVIDVPRGHVGDGSEHQTADDEEGSDAENSNKNNVAVVQTQDNAIVKGGDDGGDDGDDDGGDEPPSPEDLG